MESFSQQGHESGNDKVLQKHDEKPEIAVPLGLWRNGRPSTYRIKFESFKTMMELVKDGYYESRPFTAGGYNWTFLIYPTGNRKETQSRFVSVYARIQNSCLIPEAQAVYAEIKFFVYAPYSVFHYYYYQETEPVMFHSSKPEWGVPLFLDTRLFETPGVGYISPGGQCEFGIDVLIRENNGEVFSYNENICNPIFKWNLTNFSTRCLDSYTSLTFTSGGRNWVLKVYPNGNGDGRGNYLSLYLLSVCNGNDYVRAKLRVLNQISCNHVVKQVERWSNAAENGWGFEKFISLSDLKDGSKGFVVADLLEVEVEIMACSKADSI